MLDCDCAAVVSGSCGRCIDRATIDRLAFERNEAVASALRFSEQRDALRAALEYYGEHRAACAYDAPNGIACTCGLDAAIAKSGGGNG